MDRQDGLWITVRAMARQKSESDAAGYGGQEGWGDDAADAAAANPHFSHELYKHLSKSARRNLAMVDETIIDYELVETVIDLIDAQHGPGAVLVFLPGTASLLCICLCCLLLDSSFF